jgi:hypothetical protein
VRFSGLCWGLFVERRYLSFLQITMPPDDMPFEPSVSRGLAALGALSLCCSSPAERSCDIGSTAAPLTNGAVHAEYLRLEPRQEAAVVHVRLTLTTPPSEDQCSGVLVADRMVLTALHCARDQSPQEVRVVFGSAVDQGVFETVAVVVDRDVDADLLLLGLAQKPNESIDVIPMPAAADLPSGFSAGSLVQVAGFGYDEHGQPGRRAFLVEETLTVDHDTISAGARGVGGACLGDSGGPLLVRGNDGGVRVLGILGSGTASCYGRDVYARVDVLRDWLEKSGVPPDLPPSGSDAAFGLEGRCFDGRAVWSTEGRLKVGACQEGEACGWDRNEKGYRCVPRATDPCAGISDVGICQNQTAVRCDRGTLRQNPCSACGLSCRRSTTTGFTMCLPESDGGTGD